MERVKDKGSRNYLPWQTFTGGKVSRMGTERFRKMKVMKRQKRKKASLLPCGPTFYASPYVNMKNRCVKCTPWKGRATRLKLQACLSSGFFMVAIYSRNITSLFRVTEINHRKRRRQDNQKVLSAIFISACFLPWKNRMCETYCYRQQKIQFPSAG